MPHRPCISIMLTEDEQRELKSILAARGERITTWGRRMVREEIIKSRRAAEASTKPRGARDGN